MKPKKPISGLKLALKTSVVSGMTLLSRILGRVRDVVFARFFGAGLLMDAFLVAQRIPNMLRRFFAEGAFSAGFVPVMARYKEQHDHDEAREYLDAMAGTFGVVLFVVTLVGVIAAPLLVLVVAPGFISDGGDFDLAALMLRFTFPYLFFISLTAFAGGILNTYGRFGVPAFTPVLLNVVLIAAAVWVAPLLEQPIMALAYAVFIAGAVQLLFQWPFLVKIRALPRPKWRPQHEGVRRAFKNTISNAASTLGFAAFSLMNDPPEWIFWIIGNGVGFGLGGIGTASRSLVGRFTPAHKTAEFFGLWGMVFKGAGVVGVFTFGQVRAMGGGSEPNDFAALLLLAGEAAAAGDSVYRYNICNGLSNQLLYHAASIANAVKKHSTWFKSKANWPKFRTHIVFLFEVFLCWMGSGMSS